MYTLKDRQEILRDPKVFEINRKEPHTIFDCYNNLTEAIDFKESKKILNLNGLWHFKYKDRATEKLSNFYAEEEDYTTWETITVPSHIQLQGYGKPQYLNRGYPWDGHENITAPEIPVKSNPVGYYVKSFEVPKDWQIDQPIHIRFDGVESAFFLWVNGNFVGYSEDSFTPANFDISSYVVEGKNTIALEVYKYCSGSWLEDQDFFRFSGIFRGIFIEQKNCTHLYDFGIKTSLSNDLGKVDTTVWMDIFNCRKTPTNVQVSANLYWESEHVTELGETTKCIEPNQQEKISLNKVLENLALWSAEKPNLYTLVVCLKTEEEISYIPYKIGFRKFEIKDNIMYLNNKRIIFNGVNRHEFSAETGRVIGYDEMVWDIQQLKRHNINAVRTSHYPNNHKWYQLCDEYGIYVIDEANIETHGTWKYGEDCSEMAIPSSKKEWTPATMDRIKSMYYRDKNHPSILIWSLGNESYGGENFVLMKEYLKSMDAERLVHYEGVFHDKAFEEATEIESTMYFPPDKVKEYLKIHTEKPYIQCEYAHAMGNSLGALDKYTALANEIEHYQGGFIWDYIDQAIWTQDEQGNKFLAYGGDFDDYPNTGNFSGNGLVMADRTLSPKIYATKYSYQDIEIDVDIEENCVRIRNKYLFTNLDEFDVKFKVELEGHILSENEIYVELAPGEEKKVKLPSFDVKAKGTYVVTVSVHTKKRYKWADKGYEVAYGQSVLEIKEDLLGKEAVGNEKTDMEVVEGQHTIGFYGENFSYAFSKQQERWISLKYKQSEMLTGIARPNFWRAPTDNDLGNKMPFRCHLWKSASDYMVLKSMTLNESGQSKQVIMDYSLPMEGDVSCTVIYTIYSGGKLHVNVCYKGIQGLPELPELSFMFGLKKCYDQMTWFGLGPFETYADRKQGAKYSVYHTTVKENLTQYLNPQECGKKSNCKWITLQDSEGKGIKISAIKENLDFSVLEYTPNQIEMANHPHELGISKQTVVRVISKHMGVGGDDSWGAKVHEEYTISSEKTYAFDFEIECID